MKQSPVMYQPVLTVEKILLSRGGGGKSGRGKSDQALILPSTPFPTENSLGGGRLHYPHLAAELDGDPTTGDARNSC